jgi:hypothetical protein
MNNLDKLKEAIYKALPRLTKIKVGQRFHSNFYGEIIATRIDRYSDNKCAVYGFDVKQGLPRDNYYPRDLTLLGQEPQLNDVLEWINKEPKANILVIIRFCDTFKWDLSKPLLKDQSQELIDYLTSLV